jgi:hypothetical protein
MPLDWEEVPDCDPAAFTLVTAPKRFAERGDAAAGIDDAAGSLDKLLELSASQAAAGQGDAPWPPHYEKKAGEPPRVQPSKRKKGENPARASNDKRPEAKAKGSGKRLSKHPLITISKAERKEDALAGLERWKAKHPQAAQRLAIDDVLVDPMRGRYTTWTRIRVNLRHVPEDERPAEEGPDPDYDPWKGWEPGGRSSLYPPSYRKEKRQQATGEGGGE